MKIPLVIASHRPQNRVDWYPSPSLKTGLLISYHGYRDKRAVEVEEKNNKKILLGAKRPVHQTDSSEANINMSGISI